VHGATVVLVVTAVGIQTLFFADLVSILKIKLADLVGVPFLLILASFFISFFFVSLGSTTITKAERSEISPFQEVLADLTILAPPFFVLVLLLLLPAPSQLQGLMASQGLVLLNSFLNMCTGSSVDSLQHCFLSSGIMCMCETWKKGRFHNLCQQSCRLEHQCRRGHSHRLVRCPKCSCCLGRTDGSARASQEHLCTGLPHQVPLVPPCPHPSCLHTTRTNHNLHCLLHHLLIHSRMIPWESNQMDDREIDDDGRSEMLLITTTPMLRCWAPDHLSFSKILLCFCAWCCFVSTVALFSPSLVTSVTVCCGVHGFN
jgi:hypothetical protein